MNVCSCSSYLSKWIDLEVNVDLVRVIQVSIDCERAQQSIVVRSELSICVSFGEQRMFSGNL